MTQDELHSPSWVFKYVIRKSHAYVNGAFTNLPLEDLLQLLEQALCPIGQ